jgi:hypothetical protein
VRLLFVSGEDGDNLFEVFGGQTAFFDLFAEGDPGEIVAGHDEFEDILGGVGREDLRGKDDVVEERRNFCP